MCEFKPVNIVEAISDIVSILERWAAEETYYDNSKSHADIRKKLDNLQPDDKKLIDYDMGIEDGKVMLARHLLERLGYNNKQKSFYRYTDEF